jgi:mitogen-activated protein kinase 1/3
MQVESCPRYQERVPLFPGRSCFPLSADRPTTYSDKLDQLNVIFNVIGTPGENDIGSLGEVRLPCFCDWESASTDLFVLFCAGEAIPAEIAEEGAPGLAGGMLTSPSHVYSLSHFLIEYLVLQMYPGAPADSLDLLKQMLSFNPDTRITVRRTSIATLHII